MYRVGTRAAREDRSLETFLGLAVALRDCSDPNSLPIHDISGNVNFSQKSWALREPKCFFHGESVGPVFFTEVVFNFAHGDVKDAMWRKEIPGRGKIAVKHLNSVEDACTAKAQYRRLHDVSH